MALRMKDVDDTPLIRIYKHCIASFPSFNVLMIISTLIADLPTLPFLSILSAHEVEFQHQPPPQQLRCLLYLSTTPPWRQKIHLRIQSSTAHHHIDRVDNGEGDDVDDVSDAVEDNDLFSPASSVLGLQQNPPGEPSLHCSFSSSQFSYLDCNHIILSPKIKEA